MIFQNNLLKRPLYKVVFCRFMRDLTSMNSHKSEEFVSCQKGDALIIVDVQNDFLPPNGSLAVAKGDEVIQPINKAILEFQHNHLPIYATRDWHPTDHCSFKQPDKKEGIWPPHCVAETLGAQFPESLNLPLEAKVISKATQPNEDAYSGFQGTELGDLLKATEIKRVFVAGLATDYCVLNTVKDALGYGFEVVLLLDAVRAVNVKPEDGAAALEEMKRLGVVCMKSL